MKKLIIAQTPYQIIVSLYIKKQFSNNSDICDLIITNNFNNYNQISKRIKELKIFNNVYIAEAKNLILPKEKLKKLMKLFYVLMPKRMIKKSLGEISTYDEIYMWNYDAYTATLRTYLTYKNKNLKCYIYDEGYISYFPINEVVPKKFFLKLIEFRNKIIGLKDVTRENISGYLLFEPELKIYVTDKQILKIDRDLIFDKKFRQDIEHIFDAEEISKQFDKKFIIFEEAILSNDKNIDDEKVILDVANLVGKNNVLVKLHPRTGKDRFKDKGIKTLLNGVPWEAILLSNDFSDKVLIAIGSGSIPNTKMFYGDNMKGIMLFRIIPTPLKYMSNQYNLFWDKIEYKNKINKKGIFIPETQEQLEEILRGEL